MRLTLLAATIFFLGCPTIGRVQIDPVPPAPVSGEEGQRVVLVVIDGLGQADLGHYLARLRTEDYEPDWPSGIAQLHRDGYRFAAAGRAEAPIPGTRLVSAATLATGRFPDEHGIVGQEIVAHGIGGGVRLYDFGATVDAMQTWRLPNLARPSETDRPLTSTLLTHPTWFEAPGAASKTAVIFSPFGEGSHWTGPRRIGDATAALRRSALGSTASPLLDRAARDAALAFLLADRPVVMVHFHGLLARGCFDAAERCRGGRYDHQRLRQAALRDLDHHLARMLKRYAIERPRQYARTHFFVVGTGGQLSLSRPPKSIHRLGRTEIITRLAAHVRSDDCKTWWADAQAPGHLTISGSGGHAQIALPRRPRGQENVAARDRRCLRASLGAVTASGDWLDAAVSVAPSTHGEALAVSLHEAFASTLDTSRRARLMRKLARATTAPSGTRGGDALLFAKAPYVFVSSQSDEQVGHARQGGLTDAESRIGLLVASRVLEEDIANGLRIAPIELNDVPPTVGAIIGLDPPLEGGRPPFLEWIDGETPRLGFVRADRTIRGAPERANESVIWSEDTDHVILGRTEPTALWPPDSVTIRLGTSKAVWDADREAFRGDGHCTYAESKKDRRWSCRFPLDRSKARVDTAVTRRVPGATNATPDFEQTLFPVVIGQLTPQFDAPPQVVCATPTAVRVRSHGKDPLGLSRVEVFLADDRIGPASGLSGSLLRGTDTSRITPNAACAEDALNAGCQFEFSQTAVDTVDVPFSADILAHHARARQLGGTRSIDVGRLRAAYRKAGADATDEPERAWLGIRICSHGGACQTRALTSDLEYRRLVAKGCP